jgi:GR25 family glycosyltransferase involved in LPS biosynthesis
VNQIDISGFPDLLTIVVISTPNSTRKDPLIESLSNVAEVRLVELDAVMLNRDSPEYNDPHVIDKAYSKLIYGRELSPGEYGCAISNASAQKLLAKTSHGGVILEDDARILDLSEFLKVSRLFLSHQIEKSAVLSFFDGASYVKRQKSLGNKSYPWISVFGHTSFTVAYAITPLACKKISKSNTPISYLADWPVSKSKFFLSSKSLVKHGDENTSSIISSFEAEKRIRPTPLRRLSVFTFIYYVQRRKNGLKLKNFTRAVWLPKVYWYLNKVKKIILLREVN